MPHTERERPQGCASSHTLSDFANLPNPDAPEHPVFAKKQGLSPTSSISTSSIFKRDDLDDKPALPFYGLSPCTDPNAAGCLKVIDGTDNGTIELSGLRLDLLLNDFSPAFTNATAPRPSGHQKTSESPLSRRSWATCSSRSQKLIYACAWYNVSAA
ncbi:hypothetical protein LTR10_021931 [Elasticomyces elasticus]|uniref:Uncharacterized protein n=1 Tax=Exophiala sideris TaxID=1016849 RepID=A0ABR0IX08_9EURO|nr:hypothetical protein LTR10_021931 [Elasticomyces elasticus]KAK5021837.1 hypothetical protein LTS07_010578 [Exophiala sideris]KAK5025902.1 hypothetical protein LTR13_010215 [Exophiala sideris]KAK5050267.1 hypothetical protein LTR69_010602 [Exophiala sideris]KAK5177128.1 hypothetical protein LTR44_010412 [Eurotiomycetes sp. CCFEE 6388]